MERPLQSFSATEHLLYIFFFYAKTCSFHRAYNVIAGLTLQATLVL